MAELTQQDVNRLKELCETYRKDTVNTGDFVITVEARIKEGHVYINEIVKSTEPERVLKYAPNSYDYISVRQNQTCHLYTDESGIEPYNCGSIFYVPFRFENMTHIENNHWFYKSKVVQSSSYGIWGFSYNSVWKYVQFGIVVSSSNKDSFLKELQDILQMKLI